MILNTIIKIKIIFLIIALCINDAMAVPKILDKIIAIVDTSIVLESDINTLFSAEKNIKILHDNFIIRRKMINRLIMDNIILQLAERAKITISYNQLDYAIAATQKYINIDQLHSRLSYEGIDYNAYCRKIRQEILLAEVLNFLVRSRIIIFQQEIDALAKNTKNKVKNIELNWSNIFITLPANYQKKVEKVDYLIKLIMQQSRRYEDFNSISITNYTDIQVLKANNIGWSKKKIFLYCFMKI